MRRAESSRAEIMATIADVARAAGVSRSTVSYALSGKRPITKDTQDRVARAISDLGFTVNAGARALATAQTMVLGLLVQFHDDEFAPAMLQYILGTTTAARERGYDILMVTEADGVAALERITSSNMVDGVVLLNVTDDDPRLAALRAASQPGALIGLPADTADVDVFDLDFEASARTVVQHLAGLGHREAILITPPHHVFDRGGAYGWRFRDEAIAEGARVGLRINAVHGESQQPAISASVHRALEDFAEATALIVHNDAAIAALPVVLHERGVHAPADLSVVGIYSNNFGRTFHLPYTAIESSPDALGRLAVERIVERIVGADTSESVVHLVAPELIDRGSTGTV
jgi:DNA-binding LacI/PurR family transcriptional regulator